MKTLLTTFAFLIVISLNAQEFQGKAIYKTSRKSNFKIGGGKNSTMSEKQTKALEARLKKMNQKTFILKFDRVASTYKEDVKLKAPKPNVGGANVMVMSLGGSGSTDVYYKNIKEKRFVNQTEIMGKRFLVKDQLAPINWEMTTETKNIGKYTCYKATYSREVENTTISMVDGEAKEVKKTETIVTTAWYTPQVPISNGPKNYQGLPGLILEINDGKNTIVCTEIVLNPSDTIMIDEPTKGKVVTQEKYEKISEEKSREMMEKFKSRRGVDLGNGVNIKIGG